MKTRIKKDLSFILIGFCCAGSVACGQPQKKQSEKTENRVMDTSQHTKKEEKKLAEGLKSCL